MAYNEKTFTQGSALTNAAATYYTVGPTVIKAIVKEMVFCNTSVNPETVTLYMIPNGGSLGVASTQFKQLSLQPNETQIYGRTLVMNVGDFIQALASTAAVVSMNISGVERT